MALFHRRPVATGRFRVVGVTPLPGTGSLVVNGVALQRLHVSGIVEVDGRAPEAAAVDAHLGADRVPASGAVLPVEVLRERPLRIRVDWEGSADARQVQAAQQDAIASVVADLATGERVRHAPGEFDPLGVALTADGAGDLIAEQVAAVLGTPISTDVDLDGAHQHRTANRSAHLSSAEAAELLRSGVTATAVVRDATRVPIPQAMLPGPGASLWDLGLEVRRTDGTAYRASTRVGFRTEARRGVLGLPGLTIPVRVDPDDDTRVAVDGATFDAAHPDAPRG